MFPTRQLQSRQTSCATGSPARSSLITHHSSLLGFTLVEMLTVIAIIGIIAALAVPALKNFGKSDVNVSASRQLLDDIGHARQLAMSQRTTVYMVFLSTNYWVPSRSLPTPPTKLFDPQPNSQINPAQQLAGTNLLDKQLSGYIDMAYGAVGDQPGSHRWHYLTSWASLPAGAYIPLFKFYNAAATPAQPYTSFSDPLNANISFNINPFSYTNTFPFPTQDSTNASAFAIQLPYIAFNYLGQLSDYSGNLFVPQPKLGVGDNDSTGGGIDIPISQGNLVPPHDPSTKELVVGAAQVVEMPPGNTTNISYTVVHIDPITGRATLQFHKQQ